MYKLKNKILLISLILVLLFSFQAVSAETWNNGNLTSESIDLYICDNEGDVNSDKISNTYEDVLSTSDELDELGIGSSTYSQLSSEIGSGGDIELQYGYYTYDSGDTISIDTQGVIDGKGAVIDMAGSNIRAFSVSTSGVTIKNLTIKNANYNGNGGAIYFSDSGTVENCNFINNTAIQGGAIRFESGTVTTVTNCNFVNNTARYGGAVFLHRQGTVENCNFIDNFATGDYSSGGAVFISEGAVKNCNFTKNVAGDRGGSVWMDSGSVENCNFVNNTARYGGAVCFWISGEVINCNFINNTASDDGGAIIMDSGTVTNCNFINNIASDDGGAVSMGPGTFTICNFVNNTARYGGAVFIYDGAIGNCNFTGNIAVSGSAIYFFNPSATKSVFNSYFLNNRANTEELEVIINNGKIEINFTGFDNLLNAIYSRNNAEVSFTNVVYWGANGIMNTGSSVVSPSRSKNEAGQNITVRVVVNGVLVLDDVKVTDTDGKIVLNIITGDNYYISASHDTDSYYTEAEKTIENMAYNVNVTSKTTHNRTVNITAKSNIYNEFMPGNLIFILPNNEEISANYGGDGNWWAVYTFGDYEVYQVNASYNGLDNVVINNGTVTIIKASSSVSADDVNVRYGEPISIVVRSENATDVSYKIIDSNNNTVKEGTVKAGELISVSGLDAGDYTVNLTTVVDSNHASASNTSKLHIGHAVSIKLIPIIGYSGEVISITAQLQYENGDPVNEGTASLTVNYDKREVLSASLYSILSADESVQVSGGQAVFNVKLGAPGIYPYVVSYSGSDVVGVENESTLTVLKVNTTVSGDDISGKPSDKKDIVVNVSDYNKNPVTNGTVTLTVDGKTYTADVVNGVATFKDVVLPNKDTVADVYYRGNDYYNASSATVSIKIQNDTNNTESDSSDTESNTNDNESDENDTESADNNDADEKSVKNTPSTVIDSNATGNPIAIMLLALFSLIITYRKK